ncbi:hypothetical protein D3C72_2250330 [compost metagenome]
MLQLFASASCDGGSASYAERDVRAKLRAKLAQLVLRNAKPPQTVQAAQRGSRVAAAAR